MKIKCQCMSNKCSMAVAKWTTMWAYSTIWTLLLFVLAISAQDDNEQDIYVEEEIAIGTVVGVIGEGISNVQAPYKNIINIGQGDIATDWDINLSTGEIQVNNRIDREKPNGDYYQFIALSEAGTNVNVAIHITDINDNSPIFPKAVVVTELSESAPPDVKIPLNEAEDEDIGVYATQSYAIVEGNIDNVFALNTRLVQNGKLLVEMELVGDLNYEVTSFYSLLIKAYDGGNPRLEGTLRVNISIIDANDNQPIFNSSRYFAEIPENSTNGTSVLKVFATDMDSGENGEIRYHINRQQSDQDKKFEIDAETGIVTVNNNLDYETQRVYELIVVAKDNGSGQRLQTTAIVSVTVTNVNDNRPDIDVVYLTEDGTGQISEKASSGDYIARISVSDPDTDATAHINVSLSGGEGYFGLTVSGNVVYLVLKSRPLDREIKPLYELTIIATDSGTPPLSAEKSLTLYISDTNDNAPVFDSSTYHAEIEEVVPPGSSVFQLSAIDRDEGNNSVISYEIAHTPETHSDWFAIDNRTGLITTRIKVDCETAPTATLTVVATDAGTPPMSTSAEVVVTIINVNDNQPQFEQSFYNVTVAENAAIGDCFLTVRAEDPDCGQNEELEYRFPDGVDEDPAPLELEVKSEDGRICVKSRLDYESKPFYFFKVQAMDEDEWSSVTIVTVNVEDVNDNRPIFYPTTYVRTLTHSIDVGEEVAVVAATDLDSGTYGEITYNFASGNGLQLFEIDSKSGLITIAAQIPESMSSITLTISARDGGNKIALTDAQVDISFLSGGSPASAPTFSKRLYDFEVPENTGKNMVIDTVSAAVQGVQTSAIRYIIESGDPSSLFQMNEVSGEIRVANDLDHDTQPYVLLNIRAQTGSPSVYGYAQVNISITDINDNSPDFPINPITITLKEDYQQNAPFYKIHAYDIDSGNNGLVEYEFDSNTQSEYSDLFEIRRQTGQISLIGNLDHENRQSYNLVVKAMDKGSPIRISLVDININVADVNDNNPVFGNQQQEIHVAESADINFKFTQIEATDEDSGNNGRITFSLSADSDVFGVFPNDGFLYNKVLLDRESQESYILEVVATDDGLQQRSATATMTIIVDDVNDNSPIFLEDEYTFYFMENQGANSQVGFVTASDLDQADSLSYSLTKASMYFSVVANSGEIIAKESLNREDIEFHTISVRASDSGSPSRSSIVGVTIQVLDENDNKPTFDRIGDYVVDVDENQPKTTLVLMLSASDPDKGENSSLTFSFTSNNEAYVMQNFQIHTTTGRITTLESLDHEKRALYRIEVAVQDAGSPSLQSVTTVEVTVNDENESEPVFDQAHLSLTVNENTAVDKIIGHVKAQDNDGSDTVTYYIIGGNRFGTFLVNSSTGAIIIARPVDYEESSRHAMQIRAVDSNPVNPKSSIINVNITVIDRNDNPPRFEHDPIVFNVRENIPHNTIVHTFNAIDLDSGLYGRMKYEILSQSPSGPWFSINPNTGDLITVKDLDYEEITKISLVVKASDQPNDINDVLFVTVTTLVFIEDKNDNKPVFQQIDRVDVFEDEPKHFPIMHVIATDSDSLENGRVSYIIVSGNNLGHFSLDSETGLLSIAKELDREVNDLFHLNVSARDHGIPRMTAHTMINIYIVDINDNAPKFDHAEYRAFITENSMPSTSIITVTATDSDIGLNAELNYLIPDGILDNKFTVGLTSGIIKTNVSLDREVQETYMITVYVKDKAFPALYDTCTVIVTVNDMNDNMPLFSEDSYQLDVPENNQMSSVHSVLATDMDSGRNQELNYFIVGGNTGNLFSIDPQTGRLSCLPLDREVKSSYTLTIEARDGGGSTTNSHSSQTTVSVNVLDDNDNDPKFNRTAYSQSLPEDTPVDSSVLKIEATDADTGDNAKITYSISESAGGVFKIDNITGVINTTRTFDHEVQSTYSFDVHAMDGGLYGPRTTNVRVVITITDINDNSPVFTQIPYKGEISQNTAPDTSVLTVIAEDADSGQNGAIEYSLKESSTYFMINSLTGVINTKQLDSGAVARHHLLVVAQDRGSTPRSATGVVEIVVGNPISQNSPVFTSLNYSKNVPEDANFDDVVISVTANSQGPLRYDFASGNEDNIFSIDSLQGLITVNRAEVLDYETRPTLRLTVVAARTDVVANAYATVWINVQDANDNSPRFSQDRYVSAVWEGNNRGTYVTQVIATDLDFGRNSEVTYSIISGNLHKGVKSFVIDPPYTGIVKTNIILDREIVESWKLTVEAIDGGSPPLSSTCVLKIQVIDVNDHEPFFPAYSPLPVKEGVEVGALVLTIAANDADLNPILQYNFAPGGNPENTFSIDAYSGKIAVAKTLDYETVQSYTLTVQASDKNHTVSTEVRINVVDENDNPPVFEQQSYQVPIDEATPPETLVTVVMATDMDAGDNGKVHYTMISTPGFYIDSVTGSIYTNQTVSYNKNNPTIHLVVTAQDHGNPVLSAVEAVRVQVVDINNNRPEFTQAVYRDKISEDESPGLIIIHAEAIDDDDTYENQKIDYSIISGNEESKFQIVSKTGNIVLIGSLNREKTPSYRLEIMARDRGVPPLESTSIVEISILDVNDNAPVFSPLDYSITVPENLDLGSELLSVSATDLDNGPNSQVQFQIASGNDDNNFRIDRDTGLITLHTGLDHETHKIHKLIVSATDSSVDYPRQSAFTTVLINVTDINEYTPRFPVLMYVEEVGEKLDVGTHVFTAHANDEDSGYFGILKYELLDHRNRFTIDDSSGEVTTNMQLLYSDGTTYQFQVKATDNAGRFSKIPVLVKIMPRFIPKFTRSQFSFGVRGDAKQGDIVGQIQVDNADASSTLTNSAGVVIFSFSEPHEYFSIAASTGIIVIAKDLQSPNETTRRKRSSALQIRNRRALVDDEVVLTIVASVGYPPVQATTTVQLAIDRLCGGCQAIVTSGNDGGGSALSGTPLVLLIVSLIILAILAIVIIIMFLRGREKQKRKRDAPRFDASFTNSMESHPPIGYGPPSYNDAQMYPAGHNMMQGQMTGSSMSEHSVSVSSGRGSADMDIPEDEEIRMINATPMDHQAMRGIPPDSGIQHDEDAASEHSAQNHQEYLARLGIDTSKIKSSVVGDHQHHNKNGINASVESMHQFSDEGGGEGDGMDGTYNQQQRHGNNGGGDLTNGAGEEEAVPVLESTQQFGMLGDSEQTNPGSLSSVINSEEEFSGSYNWDYLLDWGPQYQPLADVFVEIARLKDDSIKPKKVPTKIISQNSGGSGVGGGGNNGGNFQSAQAMRPLAFPPPIITDAPPRAAAISMNQQQQQPLSMGGLSSHQNNHNNSSPPNHHVYNLNNNTHYNNPHHQQHNQHQQQQQPHHHHQNRERKDSSSSNSNQTLNSARTSQLTSMASLPKSPISYESSFTTTPLSPDFENSLSPLQHRSPSFSPIVTPTSKSGGVISGGTSISSGHNTPHSLQNGGMHLSLQQQQQQQQHHHNHHPNGGIPGHDNSPIHHPHHHHQNQMHSSSNTSSQHSGSGGTGGGFQRLRQASGNNNTHMIHHGSSGSEQEFRI